MRMLFCHIPKNAGTSLAIHLSQQFPQDQVFGIDNTITFSDDFLANTRSYVSKYSFISGHISLESVRDVLPEFDLVLAVVRPPVERLISMYNYKRNEEKYASCSNIFEFLDAYYMQNVATRNEQCSYIGYNNTFEACVASMNDAKNLRVIHSYRLQDIGPIVQRFGLSIANLPRLNSSDSVFDISVTNTQLYGSAFKWFDGDFALSDYVLSRSFS